MSSVIDEDWVFITVLGVSTPGVGQYADIGIEGHIPSMRIGHAADGNASDIDKANASLESRAKLAALAPAMARVVLGLGDGIRCADCNSRLREYHNEDWTLFLIQQIELDSIEGGGAWESRPNRRANSS